MKIRPATAEDSRDLAYLTNLASEGMALYMWGRAAPPGMSALEFGASKVDQENGNFSYRNAVVAEADDGSVAGMLLSMLQPSPYPLPDFSTLPPQVRPLIELEALAPGSYYINVLAVYEHLHGKGIGSLLMNKAEELAAGAGANRLSLIVASENHNAKKLYLKLGYKPGRRLPVVPYEGMGHGGDWVLMTKGIDRLG